ncbi:MAG: cadmium-translocating P-type ATPase [Bacilli bacterium]|nr:cadmium-translocating P-type ATPase [Bacilli bacterium]
MKKFNFEFFKIMISTIIFIIAVFLKNNNILFISLLVISYVIVSNEMYIKALKNILVGEIFDENFLMIIATLGAFYIGEYEEALMVMLLFNLGEYLSDKAVDNSKESITKLMDLRSDTINLKIGDDIKNINIKDAKLNDLFIVKPGEKIGLDGIIIDGVSNVDTSSLTGESIPRNVKKDMCVLSGTTNLDAVLTIKATSTYKTSTATKIIELIESSDAKKAKTEKFITKFCKIYTPIVVISAVLLTLIPFMLGGSLNDWLYKSLVFLVTSCPCALVISVPLGYFAGIGRASKEGILVKGGNELENLSKIKTIVFDKTGTITKGNFDVTKIHSIDINEDALLEIAAYAEFYSNHPIAKSILKRYSKEINKNKINDFKEISGKGISVKIDDDSLLVGNYNLLISNNIDVSKIDEIGTIVYIAKDKKYLGYIVITDEIKEEANNLVKSLKKEGIIKIIMLSGDNKETVEKVSSKLGFSECYYEMLPIDKVNKVTNFKKENFTAFVGDGINDAPVMKIADLGISMGGVGSDAAIEASSIVLMTDNLDKISDSIKISKKTNKIVHFNIVFALIVKFIFLLLGTLGYSKIWYAVIADVGVTLLLVLNSLRLIIKSK